MPGPSKTRRHFLSRIISNGGNPGGHAWATHSWLSAILAHLGRQRCHRLCFNHRAEPCRRDYSEIRPTKGLRKYAMMLNCDDLVRFYPIVKKSLVAFTIFFSAIAASFGDLKPNDSSAPILQYFAPVQIAPRPGHEDAPNLTFDQRKPLLTITSVRQLIPNRDGRGVTIVLNEKDKQRYAELTSQFKGRLLICVAASDVISVGVVTSATENGMIEFSDSRDTGNIAKYLRRRFGM